MTSHTSTPLGAGGLYLLFAALLLAGGYGSFSRAMSDAAARLSPEANFRYVAVGICGILGGAAFCFLAMGQLG